MIESQKVNKYLKFPEDCRSAYFTEICNKTNLALSETTVNRKNVDTSNAMFITTKDEVKDALYHDKKVIVYLAIEELLEQREIFTLYDRHSYKVVQPYVIVGWSDYEYLSLRTPLGVQKRHRGFFMVVSANDEMSEANIHYIPYKHFDICVMDGDPNLVREVWAVNDLHADIVQPKRPGFDFQIGETKFFINGERYLTDAGAHYHTYGNPLVPLREFTKRIGYDVKWHRFLKIVELKSSDKHIEIFIGKDYCKVNGKNVPLQFPVTLSKHTRRSYINLGFIRHILELECMFDKSTETVHIFTD